ncbi:hypothetical protein N7489_008796 [Penicillium chrysogenum]|uniref:Uncharacterized protein n=1 Tax=Penicillium chrysogenum TaxID=5076 RepID=A0ABQ8WZ36_PENCH|nr:uncharacterized protein N7489_008796 [Penicillium chrysogenum]KAJ5228088.1 hypothetical protein N7489_008796 [Penicillium chrysogenum]KAJ5284280.1 hypothetical protein N7505_002260 [Penicillium chrysogenum]KAJ6167595.1 hypothetical protein N7497_000438 [Penicillium chrysogenum]
MPRSQCAGRDVEGFLADLPPSTNRYTYEGKERFEEIANTEYHRLHRLLRQLQSGLFDNSLNISEYFVIIIDPPSFQRDFSLKLNVGVRQFYNPTLHILTLKWTLPEHSEVTRLFYDALMEALLPMGLKEAIHGYGGTSISLGGGIIKEPNGGWGPRYPRGIAKRPSVVVEVGLSAETKLGNDARMWVDPTSGEANMAITIKVSRQKPMIKIQTWEWDSNAGCPYITQSCVIEKTGDHVTVSKHRLTIPFNYIFRRSPGCPRETDIRLQKQDLVKIGTGVWEMQEL